ncbi:unnamed protein product [Rotaria sp. Silwood2]|nr:unnamed protein product [Rotaria sp. Silwood2]CAF4473090.1 unnamed protein product [Rotaria sp. Silwood2]
MDVDDCDAKEDESLQNCDKRKNIYECDVEQGCTAEFVKFGNYINHILIGKHRCTVEKLSLKDTAMKMYHSKLEEVENRRLISIDMKLTEVIDDETSSLPQGWALPIRKSNTEFSDKQREYLQKIFDEGVFGVKHWKPKEVVLDMETLKESGKFYFSASEILSENQVRSFFCRLKRKGQVIATRNSSDGNVVIKDKLVKNTSNDNDDEEIDSKLEALKQEFQDIQIALQEIEILESFSINAKTALESSCLMHSSPATSSATLKKANTT